MTSLRDLRTTGESEAAKRLGILAARALGDHDDVRERWVTLAQNLTPGVRSMRAWLDLVSEDTVSDEDRGIWLREAAQLGCYDEPIRDDLYIAFQSARDLEGLEGAISDHLALSPPDSNGAAKLSARRARCLEMLGRPHEAIDALRYSAIHSPSDATIALEKARLETLADQIDKARETLEECLDAGCEGEGRIEILGRLADLHQMEGGVRQRAIAALEDAFLLSSHDREWALRLASAHAGYGSPQRCVELLEQNLNNPPVLEEVRHWQLLARVYASHLGREDISETILWEIFAAFPQRRSSLQGLEEFYRKTKSATVFADHLSSLLAENRIQADDKLTGELWTYVGELQFSVLQRYREAELAFENARRLLGPEAKSLLREAKSTAKQPGKVRPAVGKVIEALGLANDDATVWEDAALELETMYEELQDAARLRVARQVRRSLGAEIEVTDGRVKRDPTRELEPALVWKLMGDGLFEDADLDVLRSSAPLAEKVFSQQAPSRRDHKGRKLRGEEFSAFDTFLSNCCDWLGVQKPKITVGVGEAAAQAFESGHYWVPGDRVADGDVLRARFWAGYIAGMLFTGLAPFSWVNDEMAKELLRAVAIRGLGYEIPEGSIMEDDVSGLLLTPLRRQAAAALRDNLEVLERDFPDWGGSTTAFADRAGLISCGDVSVAIEEILMASGYRGDLASPRTRSMVISNHRTRSLLLYALSDDYYMTRYESGLGQRPWLFD